ncbi:uncharacterized protein LOC9652430 [Selaginella moellendorffii]|uniref:uncharacterized protein LOC9652430 n=1 Tax=Selaginella moellendorffii TaxID=88036 RepID=UPI000D1C6008|nr:uncharacterized protein LOC9652430 [Selaginella moellendorffii]|eukprot:XP_024522542.1 uncharacterized protein LOC9652430 [Selaginella moellendorffii]
MVWLAFLVFVLTASVAGGQQSPLPPRSPPPPPPPHPPPPTPPPPSPPPPTPTPPSPPPPTPPPPTPAPPSPPPPTPPPPTPTRPPSKTPPPPPCPPPNTPPPRPPCPPPSPPRHTCPSPPSCPSHRQTPPPPSHCSPCCGKAHHPKLPLTQIFTVMNHLQRLYVTAASKKSANFSGEEALTMDIISEFGIQSALQTRMIQKHLGDGVEAPEIASTKLAFQRIVHAAFGEVLSPAFDPFSTPLSALVASSTVLPLATSLSVGILPELHSKSSKALVAGVVGALAGQDAAVRALLYRHRKEIVAPYEHSVAHFHGKVLGLTTSLELLSGAHPAKYQSSLFSLPVDDSGVSPALSQEQARLVLQRLGFLQ